MGIVSSEGYCQTTSMARRRNTVHDLANLRLHPDGSRVHNTDRQSKYLALDARGNRIAVDAGGSGRVKKRRRAQSVEEEGEDQEDIDIEKSELSNEQSNSDSGSKLRSKQKEKEKSLKDPRAKKRHKAQDNQAFFESETHAIPSWEDMGLPNPSSVRFYQFLNSMITNQCNPGPTKMYPSFCYRLLL